MALVADFLISRLSSLGLGHIFGTDEGLSDLSSKFKGKINFVKLVNESNAGFAADAYARSKGIGCVLATYNIGALKICNSIALAYAERSPVVVISGSPGLKQRNEDFLFHNIVKGYDNQKKIFENITCFSAVIDSTDKAGSIIDEALDHLNYRKQPIYLEIPADLVDQPIRYDFYNYDSYRNTQEKDNDSIEEALVEVIEKIKLSKNPVILAGVQIARFNLGSQLTKFAEKHGIPIVTTLLSKSAIDEYGNQFAGVYSGNKTSLNHVNDLVTNSDCLLIFGELITDVTLGFLSPKINKKNCIFCSIDGLMIQHHFYKNLSFNDFCKLLFSKNLNISFNFNVKKEKELFVSNEDEPLTQTRFFEKINSVLDKNYAIIADSGDVLSNSYNLLVNHHNFISPAFYSSVGFAIPGSLGLKLANPNIRPIVLTTSDAFKTSMIEISTLLDLKLNPIIFIIENDKNNLKKSWNYDKIIDVFGNSGTGVVVKTEKDLNEVFNNKGLIIASLKF
jgi:indolepyruvate decarboxylase